MNEVQKQVKNIASKGRYGDSMLMHVNPMEVNAIAQQVPLTINPETGQPEAFLPFLAPIAGSLIGGSLLGGTALGALGASALGSGLAQYAVTGDLKKGLLAGLTGYGIGTALQGGAAAAKGAEAAQAATDAAANFTNTEALKNALADPSLTKAGVALPEGLATGAYPGDPTNLLNPAGVEQVTLQNVAAQPQISAIGDQAAISGFGGKVGSAGYLADAPDSILQSGKDAFSGGFKEGVSNLTTGLMQPGAYIPAGIGMGGTAVMESQELFEEQLADAERARREGRAEMFRNTPEPILYSAAGGTTQFNSGGDTDLPQIFAPDRTAYEVNPDFMPGFSPETMYFNPSTVSAPAASLSPAGSGSPMITDTYTGSKGGFGGLQASIAPQTTIDPFQAYTGIAPEGMQFEETPVPMPTNKNFGYSSYTFGPHLALGLNLADLSGMDFSNYPGYAGGGDSSDSNLKPIPADNKGLPKLPESVRNEMGYMQEGGDTQIDPLITEVTKFILGESDNNEALNAYIAKYGNEEFMKLRQQVLESIVPGAQTEGLIEGMGNGGMDDDLRGMIGNKEKIAVSQDEFIIPADVVSMLGDGSSDAGSKKLYEMMDRVRKDKTGTTQQADKIQEQNILPA